MEKKKYIVKSKPRMKFIIKRHGGVKGEKTEVTDLRWAEFLANYIDPQSQTFGNGYKSAIRANFSEGVARQITTRMPEAVLAKVRQSQRLQKAEAHLDHVIEMNEVEPIISMFGPVKDKKTGKFFTRVNPNILKVKTDVAKFLAETIGKDVYSKQLITLGFHEHKIVLNDDQLRKLDRIRAKRLTGENIGSPRVFRVLPNN